MRETASCCHENATRKRTGSALTSGLPGRINGRRTQWEDAMMRQETRQQRRDPKVAVSRRALVQGLAAGATAAAVGMTGARAQTAAAAGPAAPPSTITSPPRDFGPNGAPTTYFWDP